MIVILFDVVWTFLWLGNSAILAQAFFWFYLKPKGLFLVFIFAPILSSLSLEIQSDPLLGATGILIKMVRTEPEKRGLRPKSEKKIQVFEHWQPDGDFLIAANK